MCMHFHSGLLNYQEADEIAILLSNCISFSSLGAHTTAFMYSQFCYRYYEKRTRMYILDKLCYLPFNHRVSGHSPSKGRCSLIHARRERIAMMLADGARRYRDTRYIGLFEVGSEGVVVVITTATAYHGIRLCNPLLSHPHPSW